MIATDSALPFSSRCAVDLLHAWAGRDVARLKSCLFAIRRGAGGAVPAEEAERLELLEGIARDMRGEGRAPIRLLAHLAAPMRPVTS